MSDCISWNLWQHLKHNMIEMKEAQDKDVIHLHEHVDVLLRRDVGFTLPFHQLCKQIWTQGMNSVLLDLVRDLRNNLIPLK
jgi:hypothetical protein